MSNPFAKKDCFETLGSEPEEQDEPAVKVTFLLVLSTLGFIIYFIS